MGKAQRAALPGEAQRAALPGKGQRAAKNRGDGKVAPSPFARYRGGGSIFGGGGILCGLR